MVTSSQGQLRKVIILGILFMLLAFSPGLRAFQPDEVVCINKTYVSRDGFHPDEEITAAIEVEMTPGWHIHGNDPGDVFLIPTEILLDEDPMIEDAEIFYPEPIRQKYSYADTELLVYEGKVYFGILLHPANDLKLGYYAVKGKFSFQTCDDSSCLPPKSIEFEITFQVVKPSIETNAVNKEIFSKIIFEEVKD